MPVDAENSALEAQKKQDQEDGMYQEFDEDDYIPGDGLKLYFDLQYGF
jgi:hypothetical protein